MIVVAIFAAASAGNIAQAQSWNFDNDRPGAIAKGFSGELGNWVVVRSDNGNALAQTATNSSSTFNITLVTDTHARDVDLSVKMKAVAGETDQGGGIAWRAKDAKNYYLARYNPLEDNYRLYKVVDGKRTMFLSADIAHSDGWHTLRVTMNGERIECYYDGKKSLDHTDETLRDAGMIGLWTKADAQTQFDELTLVGN